MDLVRLRIPYTFVRSRIGLTWRDVMFGLQHELLDPVAPTEFAVDQLAVSDSSDSALIELAGMRQGEHSWSSVQRLASKEPEAFASETRAKWLFLVLGWIFEHREGYADPLGAVEEVYADFDYPECIANFVRYMPSEEPDRGSVERNEARLIERWKEYVDECAGRYAAQSHTDRSSPPDDVSIGLPADLVSVLRDVKRCLSDGTLRQVDDPDSPLPALDLLTVADQGPWPDVIHANFEDRHGRRYTLAAETFHGSGGSWKRVDQEV